MENEIKDQIVETSNPEINEEPASEADTLTSEGQTTEEHSVFKTFNTEDDYNKALQSERSKAKFSILKELGINSVDEFKSLKQTYEDSINVSESLKGQVNELSTKLELKELGVSDDKVDQFKALAKTFMTDGQTYKDVSDKVKSQFPQLYNSTKINIGVEKTLEQDTKHVSSDLKERFPWLQ